MLRYRYKMNRSLLCDDNMRGSHQNGNRRHHCKCGEEYQTQPETRKIFQNKYFGKSLSPVQNHGGKLPVPRDGGGGVVFLDLVGDGSDLLQDELQLQLHRRGHREGLQQRPRRGPAAGVVFTQSRCRRENICS